MARFSGRRVTVGLKKEAVRGTAETSGFYGYPFLTADFVDKTDKKLNESVYGNIAKNNDEITTLHRGEGALTGKLWEKGIGYLLTWLAGASPVSTPVSGDVTAISHVFTPVLSGTNANIHQSFTVAMVDPNQNIASPLSMLDSFKLTWVKDDFAKVEIATQSKVSVSGSNTITFAAENEFLPKHALIKLATNLAGLTGATESGDITAFTLEFKKNLKAVQTSKSKDQVDEIHNVEFEVSGSIEKYYVDTTFKNYDQNDTKMALRFALTDSANLAGTTTPTSLTIDLAKVSFKNWKPGYGTGEIATESLDIEGLFSVADAALFVATLVNSQPNGTY